MLNPFMLFGLFGLGVPIIIHLIHRRRLEPRLLATLRFLDQEDVANAFDPVPRDLLQLLLRLLLLALFILLMARFTLSSREVGPKTLAIILDNSMSMKRSMGGDRSLFDIHRQQIADLIEGMTAKDTASLKLVGDRVFADTGFTNDSDALMKALATFTPTDGGGRSLFAAIERSLEEVVDHKGLNTALVVFSDQQRSSYASHFEKSEAGRLLRENNVKLFHISEKLEPKPNLVAESARFMPARVYLGTSSKMTASIRNLSDEEQTIELTFTESESAGESRSVTLAAGETAGIDLAHLFESPVDVACKVTTSDDALSADNVFYSPMRMRERRQVLMVVPPELSPEDESDSNFSGVDLLGYAINPEEALGLPTGVHTAIKRVTPAAFHRVTLSMYSAIVIYGVSDLPGTQSLQDLRSYLENGGGVYFILDRSVSPVRFNETFGPLLSGFQLGAFKEPQQPLFLDNSETGLGSTMFLPLLRGEWGPTDEIYFHSYFDVQNRGQSKAVFRGRNGDWLGAFTGLGRGQVLVQLFGSDIWDSSLPRTTAFVPLVQETIAILASDFGELSTDTMHVGDVFYMQLPEYRGLGKEIEVNGVTKHAFPITDSGQNVKIDSIYSAGSYQITHPKKKTARKRWLAVNHAKGESDLAPLTDEEIKQLFGTTNVHQLEYWELARQFERRSELFTLMMILVLIALTGESLAGAWQSRKTEPDKPEP